jgi:hypothetical protein
LKRVKSLHNWASPRGVVVSKMGKTVLCYIATPCYFEKMRVLKAGYNATNNLAWNNGKGPRVCFLVGLHTDRGNDKEEQTGALVPKG